jgi:hypothetical protein
MNPRYLIAVLATAAFAQEMDYVTQIKNTPALDVRKYQWYRTSGSGASADLSTTGAKTITITKCPLGVAGANTNHYVRIYDGTGTAEAALITGGTCTSGAASGTLALTTANTHTGAWKIGTSTAGIQEAANACSTTGCKVAIPAGTHNVYAPTRIANINIEGAGATATFIVDNGGAAANAFEVFGGFYGRIAHLKITGVGKTTGWAVWAYSVWGLTVEHLEIEDAGNGVALLGCFVAHIDSLVLQETVDKNIFIDGGNDHYISRVLTDRTGISGYGINIQESGGTWVTDCDFIHAAVAVLINPGTGEAVTWTFMNKIATDTGGKGFQLEPSGTGYIHGFRCTDCWASSHTDYGVDIGNASGSTNTYDVRFLGLRAFSNGKTAVQMLRASQVAIENSSFAGNSASSVGGYADILMPEAMSGAQITGNRFGVLGATGNNVNYNIAIAPVNIDHLTITGNSFEPAGASGAIFDQSTSTSKIIKDNMGVSNTVGALASSASLSLGAGDQETYTISGTTQITTLTGGWTGRNVTLIFTDASPGGVGTGGNIARAQAAAQNQCIRLVFNGTNWY